MAVHLVSMQPRELIFIRIGRILAEAAECCGPVGRNASTSSVHLVVQADADDMVSDAGVAGDPQCADESGPEKKEGRIGGDAERIGHRAEIDIEIFELRRPTAPNPLLDTTAQRPARLAVGETRGARQQCGWAEHWPYQRIGGLVKRVTF